MKNGRAISLLIVLFCLNICGAQKLAVPNTVGENQTIHSEVLQEDRDISIYIPEDYHYSKRRYPVLYVVDGQRYFLNGVLYQKTLKWQEKTPDFIVVGINTDGSKRRRLLYEQSKMFIQFLEEELIPHIDKSYRTSKRIFFGWEMAGGVAMELLAQSPGLFSACFMASPTHIDKSRLDSLKKRLMNGDSMIEFIYFTISPIESWSIPSLENLSETLKECASEDVIWKYKILDEENHHSTPTKTIHEGLNIYFSDYAYLRFYSLKEFDDFGGMSALKEHYRKRGKKYDLPTEIHKDTKHFLLLQSIKEDDYNLFDFLINEFGDYYKSKSRDLWFDKYAQFYLKHQNSSKALEILSVGLNKFPQSSVILSGLGDSYLAKGEPNLAGRYYKKAIHFAVKSEDPNLEYYKVKLEQI